MDDRAIERVDHLHENFVDPVRVAGGCHRTPARPGFVAEILPASRVRYAYPDGPIWSERKQEAG